VHGPFLLTLVLPKSRLCLPCSEVTGELVEEEEEEEEVEARKA
jgi:hypothetical protein